jgi:Flp pilus assembly protein TadD
MTITSRHRSLLCFVLSTMLFGCAGLSGAPKSDTFLARKKLARELVARQDLDEAFFYADALHREEPSDPEVLVIRGIIYREKGLNDEAETDIKAALAQNERLPEAHAALGILYDMSGRGVDAERHHKRAIVLAPSNAAVLNNLGFSLFLRRKHAEAITEYQKAVRLDPTNKRIRTNLGFAYAATGDFTHAAKEFTRGGVPAEAKNNLGFAYERSGNLPRAYDLYLEAWRLNPKWARSRANLVHVAEKLGRA